MRRPGDEAFDAMPVSDFLVADCDTTLGAMQVALGIEKPKPRWTTGGPGAGFRNTFCRANRSLVNSPTVIGIIEATDLDENRPLAEVLPQLGGLVKLQGGRPLRTHGIAVARSELGELIESVRRQKLRHWVQPPMAEYPFSRLWMGIAPDALGDYRPEADGGLMLEVVDTAALRLPEDAFTGEAEGSDELPGATMLRVASRGFLVSDMSLILDQMASTFDWEPERGRERGEDGSQRAVLGFRLAQSARLELLQPVGDREETEFLRRWGQGVWHIRIAVKELKAKADDLRSRGTAFREVRTGFEQPEVVLRIEQSATPGCLFEFMEDA